ncbi:MAG TPA: aminotransferase class I/II-fold pyridoxal phosphate-dependent enzyme [bacterium]
MKEFGRIKRLPPYVFNIVNEMKFHARRAGEDIIDLGMGNPDLATPKPIIDKMVNAVSNPKNHRYSLSKGVPKLRLAICNWYKRRFGVDLDPETEAVVTIGAKEGISHLILATIERGEVVLVPNPTYPIHTYSVIIAGGDVKGVPLTNPDEFIDEIQKALKGIWPLPKIIIVSFPHNPTTTVVDLEFFKKLVTFAEENDILIIHDLAYADLVFDGYRAPSIFQVEGAKSRSVELFSLSKSYNMPGWRVGFAVGNKDMIFALTKLKSYFDYGMFQPIQIASIIALNECDDEAVKIASIYKDRRDALIGGLARAGWHIEKPKGTMFVWAKIPDEFIKMGSLEFSKMLMRDAKVAVSPGIGFGEYGEGFVRFALVENEHRIGQAVRGIKKALNSERGKLANE